MRALPGIEQIHMREPTAPRVIPRQVARTMVVASTRLRTVVSIPVRRIPITGTAITATGGVATAMAFTSRPEHMIHKGRIF
jgi:hypothetical protein